MRMKCWEKKGLKLTGSEVGRDFVKHVSVEVGVDGPVGGSVVARGDENRVPLSGSDGDEINRALLNVRLREKERGQTRVN